MELAIPLVALGGLYIIQNNNPEAQQNKKTQKEAFGSQYPVGGSPNKQIAFDKQEIVDSKPHTDAYFYSQNDNKKNNSFYLEDSKFQHNNMVPFSKPKGGAYSSNINESALDHMVGGGSQYIKKVEQAPLFQPQENIQWANGRRTRATSFNPASIPVS